jgi:hypothetical protein
MQGVECAPARSRTWIHRLGGTIGGRAHRLKRWPLRLIRLPGPGARTPATPREDCYLAVASAPPADAARAAGGVATGPLRRDGDASGDVVLDRQVLALQREAHALLG